MVETFHNKFLAAFAGELNKRWKAISHMGKLTIRTDPNADEEWIVVAHAFSSTPSVELFLDETRKVEVVVRHQKSKRRDQLLLRVGPNGQVVSKSDALVHAFRATINLAYDLRNRDRATSADRAQLIKIWSAVLEKPGRTATAEKSRSAEKERGKGDASI